MRPPSVSYGPYETTSELVTVVPAIDGGRSRVMKVVTPMPPAVTAAAVGGHVRERPDTPSQGLSRMGSLKADIFAGR